MKNKEKLLKKFIEALKKGDVLFKDGDELISVNMDLMEISDGFRKECKIK